MAVHMDNWLEHISPCHRIVGEAGTRPGWVEAMRVIYDHELVIFTGSSYIVELEGARHECPPDSFIIIPPGVRHVSRASGRAAGMRRWVHFDWIHMGDASKVPWLTYSPARPQEALFRPAPDFVPKGVIKGPLVRRATVLELFSRLDSLFNSGSQRDVCVSRGLLLELLLELLAPEGGEAVSQDQSSRLASRIRGGLNKFAEGRSSGERSLQDYLAKALGMSYAHQCRVFRGCYGIAPLRYVNELRMTRVKGLLRDTGLSIAEIGAMNGFESACYFSRAFRRSCGMSPREYREGGA